MATVLIRYHQDNVAIVTGDIPADGATRINPAQQTGFVTNCAFIVAAGFYCFGLDPAVPSAPLWGTVQAIDGAQVELDFA